jgi:mandelamide amidase
MTDFNTLGLRDLAMGIATGETRAEDYANYCLSRWERTKELRAITWIRPEQVLDDARNVDRARKFEGALPPLAGIPYAVKDNIDCAGIPTTAGSQVFRNNQPKRSARIVQELHDQGAVLFGKTNMHELAMGGSTNNAAYGTTRNPYDHTRVPGGSSGGAGAVVGAGIVPVALGSDTAGSVRIPAALCGVVGLRPSARNAREKVYADDGLFPVAYELDTVGPLTRTVSDLAYFDSALRRLPPALPIHPASIRLGVPREYFFEDLQSDVARATQGALLALEDSGIQLVEVSINTLIRDSIDGFFGLLQLGVNVDLPEYLKKIAPLLDMTGVLAGTQGADVRDLLERMLALGPPSQGARLSLRTDRQDLQRIYEDVLRDNGLTALVFPTTPIEAPLVEAGGDLVDVRIAVGGKDFSQNAMLIRNTMIGSYLGAPGISLPIGVTTSGLPVGIELDGIWNHDSELLALALTVESILRFTPQPSSNDP